MKGRIALFLALLAMGAAGLAAAGDAESVVPIRQSGRHFVDAEGNCVRMRGAMLSIHPFFSHGRWGGGRIIDFEWKDGKAKNVRFRDL